MENLIATQEEWSDLYFDETIIADHRLLSELLKFNAELSSDDIVHYNYHLAALWCTDGISGRKIELPRNKTQFNCLKISRSDVLRHSFNFIVVLQIIFPFFEVAYCQAIPQVQYGIYFDQKYRPTRLLLTILDIFFVTFYTFDLILIYSVNPKWTNLLTKPAATFRLLFCIAMMTTCITFFAGSTEPRVIRCLYPFLLISRRSNLILMLKGLVIAGYLSLPIVTALTSVLFSWSFVGFIFFRSFNTASGRFNSILESFSTILHCFTSRPFVLKALEPLYNINQISTIFFVTLTLAADLLCLNFIIAVGTKQYKKFASQILKERLTDRKSALCCAFDAIADENHQLSKTSWLQFCNHLNGKYQINSFTANFIYNYITLDPNMNKKSTKEHPKQPCTHQTEDGTPSGMTIERFFRACSLLAIRLTAKPKHSFENNESTPSWEGQRLHKKSLNVELMSKSRNDDGLQHPKTSQKKFNIWKMFDNQSLKRPLIDSHEDSLEEDTHPIHLTTTHMGAELHNIWKKILMMSRYGVSMVLIIEFKSGSKKKVSILNLISVLTHCLLIIQLVFLTEPLGNVYYWFYMGWVINLIFMMEMIMKICTGIQSYMTNIFHSLDFILNLSSLISLMILTPDYQSTPTTFHMTSTMVIYLILQSFRLFQIFFLFNDFVLFDHIIPVLSRASFILFSIIYFFSIFAHTYFCDALDYQSVQDLSQPDDDASSWLFNENMLNFSSYLQSLFTLFEMSLLANWSMIVDAAALSTNYPFPAFLFFYTYRLVITIMILPILVSFIIQAFLGALNRKEKLVQPLNPPTTSGWSTFLSDYILTSIHLQVDSIKPQPIKVDSEDEMEVPNSLVVDPHHPISHPFNSNNDEILRDLSHRHTLSISLKDLLLTNKASSELSQMSPIRNDITSHHPVGGGHDLALPPEMNTVILRFDRHPALMVSIWKVDGNEPLRKISDEMNQSIIDHLKQDNERLQLLLKEALDKLDEKSI